MSALVTGAAGVIGWRPRLDLSSLLQGVTHVFPLAAAQNCVRRSRDHEFRVYVDKIVDFSQQRVLRREPAQTGERRDTHADKAMAREDLSASAGDVLEEELGTENRWLSTAPALL
jgi:hypothetical protein